MTRGRSDDVTASVGIGPGSTTGGSTRIDSWELAITSGDRPSKPVRSVTWPGAHAISKGIGTVADGSCGSLASYDTPVRGEHGWRITDRRSRGSRLFKPTG